MRRAAVGSGTSQPQLWLALGKWIDPIPQARVRASNLRKYRKEEPQPPRERQPEEVDDSRSTQAPARARAPPDNEEGDPPYISRCDYAGFLLLQPRCGCSTMRDTGHFVAFCSTPGQEPLVRARVAVEESFVPETDSLARS